MWVCEMQSDDGWQPFAAFQTRAIAIRVGKAWEKAETGRAYRITEAQSINITDAPAMPSKVRGQLNRELRRVTAAVLEMLGFFDNDPHRWMHCISDPCEMSAEMPDRPIRDDDGYHTALTAMRISLGELYDYLHAN